MAKKKKKKIEDEFDAENPGVMSKLSGWAKRSSTTLLIAFILIPFMGLIFLIDQRVSKANAYLFDEETLSVRNDMPQWVMDYGLYEKIRLNNSRVRKSYLGKSYFDKGVLSNLHSKMIKNPWLKEVHLTKEMPNKIYVNIELREPKVSFLVSKKIWYYLDDDMQLLPLKEINGSQEIPIIRITGVPFTKRELKSFKPGLKLNKTALQKAITLIDEIILREEVPGKLKEIKVSYLRKKTIPRFKLIFENGLEVLWGEFLFSEEIDGFPGKQLTTQMKLDQLIKRLIKKPNTLYCNLEYKN